MAINRYSSDNQISNLGLGSSKAFKRIRIALQEDDLALVSRLTQESERLDKIAGEYYGDGRLWWVIAICSNIGWALQVPPGTLLRIPANLGEIEDLV